MNRIVAFPLPPSGELEFVAITSEGDEAVATIRSQDVILRVTRVYDTFWGMGAVEVDLPFGPLPVGMLKVLVQEIAEDGWVNDVAPSAPDPDIYNYTDEE